MVLRCCSALDFFKVQTGFKTPQDIYDRLLCFDQLLAERAKGTVLQVCALHISYMMSHIQWAAAGIRGRTYHVQTILQV